MPSKRNLWKIIGVLVLLVLVVSSFIWGPLSEPEPDPGPELQTPSMQNL